MTFCVDRAGISGADGETHQGVFDLSYLSLLPGLTIAVPRIRRIQGNAPLQRKLCPSARHPVSPVGQNRVSLRESARRAGKMGISASGGKFGGNRSGNGERCLVVAMKILKRLHEKGMDFDVVNLRFVKPLDEEVLQRCAGRRVVTIEDNVLLAASDR